MWVGKKRLGFGPDCCAGKLEKLKVKLGKVVDTGLSLLYWKIEFRKNFG